MELLLETHEKLLNFTHLFKKIYNFIKNVFCTSKIRVFNDFTEKKFFNCFVQIVLKNLPVKFYFTKLL